MTDEEKYIEALEKIKAMQQDSQLPMNSTTLFQNVNYANETWLGFPNDGNVLMYISTIDIRIVEKIYLYNKKTGRIDITEAGLQYYKVNQGDCFVVKLRSSTSMFSMGYAYMDEGDKNN